MAAARATDERTSLLPSLPSNRSWPSVLPARQAHHCVGRRSSHRWWQSLILGHRWTLSFDSGLRQIEVGNHLPPLLASKDSGEGLTNSLNCRECFTRVLTGQDAVIRSVVSIRNKAVKGYAHADGSQRQNAACSCSFSAAATLIRRTTPLFNRTRVSEEQ